MAVWRSVDFSRPEAQRLADLTGISYDLNAVREHCDMFLARNESTREDAALRVSLCVSAIIFYGRTMTSGVRSGISKEQILQLSQELQETHEHFKDVRDKFIAHSVNAFEESRVCAFLVPEERGERAISGISTQHGRVLTLSEYAMQALKELAGALLEIIETETEAERAKVLEFARTLPIDPLYEAGAAPAFTANSSPSVPRGRFS